MEWKQWTVPGRVCNTSDREPGYKEMFQEGRRRYLRYFLNLLFFYFSVSIFLHLFFCIYFSVFAVFYLYAINNNNSAYFEYTVSFFSLHLGLQ